MKKLLGISLIAVLTAAPMMAGAAVGDTVAGDPGSTASGAASATNPPKYALATETANDGKVATAGYVKGAYNAAIKAVNKLQDTKQDTISDLATIRSNASAGANALQASDITEGTTDGTIKVKGNAVSVHGLGTAAYTASTAYATAAQGTKADSAVQSVTTGTTNGTIKVDNTEVSVAGLGTAAYTASTAYATAAQGTTADTTAATVATYGDIVTHNASEFATTSAISDMVTSAGPGITKSGNKVSVDLTSNGGLETTGSGDAATLGVKVDGTTIEKNSTSGALQVKSGVYATAAQGAKADTALQADSALNGANLTAGTVAKTALASGVQTSLGKADTAVQSVAEGSTNGTVAVNGTDVAVHGLGTAAYTASADYATAAQGALAASAVQSVAEGSANGTIAVDGTDVAVHGLGTAAYTASTDYATSTQGGKADTAIQSAGNGLEKSGTSLAVKPKTNGGITVDSNGVSLTNGIQNASDTTTYTGTGLTTKGYVDEVAAQASTAISSAINGLDATVTQTAGTDGLALSVTENNGIITAVSGSIADGTYVKPADLSSYATQDGVVYTIEAATFNSSLASNAITGTVATVTDWTNETPGTAAVTGTLTDSTITTTAGTVAYTTTNPRAGQTK